MSAYYQIFIRHCCWQYCVPMTECISFFCWFFSYCYTTSIIICFYISCYFSIYIICNCMCMNIPCSCYCDILIRHWSRNIIPSWECVSFYISNFRFCNCYSIIMWYWSMWSCSCRNVSIVCICYCPCMDCPCSCYYYIIVWHCWW